jgi:glycosyltransferase involved in cell wall biosynthesis
MGYEQQRITVVSLIDHLVPYGGAEVLVAQIALMLDRERFEPVVCATRTADERVCAELEARGVKLLRLQRTNRGRVDQWWPLIRYLRETEVVVLHAHKFGSNAWAAAIRRFTDIRVVIAHEHVGSLSGGRFRRCVDRYFISPSVDRILTASAETREQMVRIERIPPDHIQVFTHGTVPPGGPGEVDRAALGLLPGDFVVGTVAVLRPEKAVDVLFRGVHLLRDELPNLRVVVVGDGPQRHALEAMVDALGLRRTVTFLGFRRDVEKLLPSMDVCVNSSHFEGSPLAVMEFMGSGRPIVATSVGGVPELLEDGACGLLVPPSDPPALAAAIRRLEQDPELRTTLAARALARHRASFDIRANIKGLERLYEQLAFSASVTTAPREVDTEPVAP